MSEDKCKKCGECCRIRLDVYCPALDPQTKLCLIYKDRFNKDWEQLTGIECAPIERAIELGVLPKSCAYVDDDYECTNSFSKATMTAKQRKAWKWRASLMREEIKRRIKHDSTNTKHSCTHGDACECGEECKCSD